MQLADGQLTHPADGQRARSVGEWSGRSEAAWGAIAQRVVRRRVLVPHPLRTAVPLLLQAKHFGEQLVVPQLDAPVPPVARRRVRR
jgi:hypothetical protein